MSLHNTGVNQLAAVEKIRKCLCDTISDAVAQGILTANLCRCHVLPGLAVAFDFVNSSRCLDNRTDGQGFVIMTGAYPTEKFPQPLTQVGCNDYSLAVNIQVGIIRSFPIAEDGEPVSREQNSAAYIQQYTEMGLMQQVLTCCFSDIDNDILLGVYTPVGPEGGAIGGYWSATVEVDDGVND